MNPPDIAATGPGKCPCCMTPCLAGSVLRLDHGKWVLIDHDKPWQPPPAPRQRRDVLDRNAIPRKPT
jgi:hypothetical protein